MQKHAALKSRKAALDQGGTCAYQAKFLGHSCIALANYTRPKVPTEHRKSSPPELVLLAMARKRSDPTAAVDKGSSVDQKAQNLAAPVSKTEKASPVLDAISKRLRAARKRLGKIKSIEDIKDRELNADQVLNCFYLMFVSIPGISLIRQRSMAVLSHMMGLYHPPTMHVCSSDFATGSIGLRFDRDFN